jgi:glycosyltransferase involved in cell wall biosynthesis
LQGEFSEWAIDKKQIFYLGYVPHDECMQIVKQSEFVVFPSIWYEGCSMVVIEAESLGKALVATDIGFSAEAIEDGYNGFKVPHEYVEHFVTGIKKLWDSPELCKKMGLNARKDYETKYMPKDNFKQLISIYENIVDSTGT